MSYKQEPSIKCQSPLGRAKNHGSAKEGTHHWISQRFSAISLLLLGPWVLYSFYAGNMSSYESVVAWLQTPMDFTLVLLFIVAGLYHGFLGLQVVIEDYVHTQCIKIPTLIALKLFFALVGVMALLSLIRIQNTDLFKFNTEKSSTFLETL